MHTECVLRLAFTCLGHECQNTVSTASQSAVGSSKASHHTLDLLVKMFLILDCLTGLVVKASARELKTRGSNFAGFFWVESYK